MVHIASKYIEAKPNFVMLYKIKNQVFGYYLNIISSIAFYPTFISITMFFLAVASITLEDRKVTSFLIDTTPYLVIDNPETARTILGTLIGGILSLTVFSFSMVMVLLNQASSNFSPRLLPGLISDKRNQIVLGIYLGTIIFNIIVLISILPNGDEYTLKGFSVLLAIMFGILCLAMFVYFIHTISTGIQINNILDKIFLQTKSRLLSQIDQERTTAKPIEVKDNWKTITNEKTGYYQGLNKEGLLKFINENQVNVLILPFKGKYLLPHMPIIKYSNEIPKEAKDQLTNFLVYSSRNNAEDNYVMGIKQITEVGIKAMSPGINDPGTAVMTIDYLTELFALRMRLDDCEIYQDESKTYKLELKTVNFDQLIFQYLAAYRLYCKHDVILMKKVVMMIKYLLDQSCNHEHYRSVLMQQLNVVKEDINHNLENKEDRKLIRQLIEEISTI